MNLNKFFQKTLLNCNLAIKDKNAEQLNFNTTQIKNSNHFFKNKEKELVAEIEKYLKEKTALI